MATIFMTESVESLKSMKTLKLINRQLWNKGENWNNAAFNLN